MKGKLSLAQLKMSNFTPSVPCGLLATGLTQRSQVGVYALNIRPTLHR